MVYSKCCRLVVGGRYQWEPNCSTETDASWNVEMMSNPGTSHCTGVILYTYIKLCNILHIQTSLRVKLIVDMSIADPSYPHFWVNQWGLKTHSP
jgi:hypothetical protein